MQKVINGTLTQYQALNPKQKNTLLILHGWGQSGSAWQTVANLLPKTYKIILLDLPGFGGTEHLPGNPSIPEYTQFVLEFIKKLQFGTGAVILGHSFGGQIAINLAANHPKLLSNLLLLSPAGIRNRVKTYNKLKGLQKLFPKTLGKFILKQISSVDYYNASQKHKNILKQIITQDLTHQLLKIKTPTTIIWGSEDKEIPYHGQTLKNTITNSNLVVLYGADHNPHLKKPQELVQTIIQNLK